MVYPHNNDLGDKKPENPSNDYTSFHAATNAEVLKIKNHYAAYTPSWVPTPKPNKVLPTSTIKMLDELIKETYLDKPWNSPQEKQDLYNKLYGKKPEPQPKLVEASKYNYTYYDPSPAPVPMKMQAAEIRFEIKGLFDKTYGANCHVVVPPEGLTEGELRVFLTNNFQRMTEKIISDVKKAKGIK